MEVEEKMRCLQCNREIKPMFKFCSDAHEQAFFNKQDCGLKCFIDGNCLCIVKDDFINLAENDAVFIGLTQKQDSEIKELITHPKKRK
jgi:hypothetical protein